MGSFFTAICAWGKTAQAGSGGILSHRLKIVRTAGCHLFVRKFHRNFRQQKCLSSPKLRDERHTAFRGTTQIRRKALRTRFPITEDDPAAHFLAAAPGRTPQTATGQLAAGDWPSLGSREGADFPIRRFSDSNMYIYTIFFSAFQGKFLGTSTKKYRLWEKKVLYYDQVF